jgi:hypothetical protein
MGALAKPEGTWVAGPIGELRDMLAQMTPVLDPAAYDFVTDPAPAPDAIATFREEEGWSSIVPSERGKMRRITLSVHSALEGVGLTAAVAARLAEHGIACNMVAAFHHDHAFVPAADAERALVLLQRLQAEQDRP